MRIILSLVLLINSLSALAATEKELSIALTKLKLFQEKVTKNCIDNPKSKDYIIVVEGKKLGCAELIVLADKKREALALEMQNYKENCETSSEQTNIDKLASQTSDIVNKAASCKPSPDRDHCVEDIVCSGLALSGPLAGAISIAAMATQNEKLKQCRNSSIGCAENVLKGIFDSIWGLVSLVWEYGIKTPFIKLGVLTGLVDESEAKTSERAMAAQTASPEFLARFKADPLKVVTDFVKDLYDAIKTAAIEHYGCQQWSGLPFNSTCLAPMKSWDCATCQQKAQVFCGVGGYAIGEIVTAYFTAGTLTAAKAAIVGAVKLTGAPAKSIGAYVAKTFPEVAKPTVELATKIGTATGKGLTAAQKSLIAAFDAFEATKVSQVIQKAAVAYHGSVVGLVTTKPIGIYLTAMDNAFRLGAKHMDAAIDKGGLLISKSGQAARVSQEVAAGRKVAEESFNPAATQVESPKMSKSNSESEVVRSEAEIANDIARFRKDPEFSEFFAKYPDQEEDIAKFLSRVEKERPDLDKAKVRQIILEELKGSCDL